MTQKQKQKLKNNLQASNNRSSKKLRLSFNLQIFNRLIFLLIISSSAYFIISINDLSIKGFILQDLKQRVSDFEERNQNLELEIMAKESYENLLARTQELKMVKVDKIDYITLIDEAVAKK